MLDKCLAQLLKEEQFQAVLGLLEQKDVVAVLPTGFGKSLIHQLFAAVKLYLYGTKITNVYTESTYPIVI